ncbi:MAG: polysaccharide biosynthesis protein [Phycisphaerales bacterium JB039]
MAILIASRHTVGPAAAMLSAIGGPAIGGVIWAGRPGRVAGAPSLGSLEGLGPAAAALGATEAIICLPETDRASHEVARAEASAAGLLTRLLPAPEDLLRAAPGGPVARAPTPIDPASLIGRAPRPVDRAAIERLIQGRRVLITGAGGSIGSELSRQAAAAAPEAVLLMERSENALFEIDRRLGAAFPAVARRALLHDVVDPDRTADLVWSLRPDVVFHAAAHKHVPLLEDHPALAIENNTLGTRSIAQASIAAGAARFVMISTDKAVKPSSVMGATKRLAEQCVLALDARSRAQGAPARCSVVRFGNVLGSACSVLEIWSAQLAEGGPITVTDPRMTRYFMTIPEAAALVMQAGAIEPAGAPAIHVLDMGEPVSILELARRFLRAHGYEPRTLEDDEPAGPGAMGIRITGVRPGEKLHEELVYEAEELAPSGAPSIWALRSAPAPEGSVWKAIAEVEAAASARDTARCLEALARAVPEMRRR